MIINQGSGKADAYPNHDHWFEDCSVVSMHRDTDLRSAIEDSMRQGVDTVIAAGGDGTVNAIVNALMAIDASRRPRLGIVPLGTANDFAGTLAVPDDIDEAVAFIRRGSYVPTDVVRIRADGFERYFANVAAGGNGVRVSERLTNEIKETWGALSYIRGAVGVLADMQVFHVTMELDGESISADSWAVLVANGRTNAGRILVAPRASPWDGLIDVILIRDGTTLDMVEIVSKTLMSDFLQSEQVIFRQVRSMRLRSDPGMSFTLDGEIIDQEPVVFEVVPGAIAMCVDVSATKR